MGVPTPPGPAKLVAGFLYREMSAMLAALQEMEARFGPSDAVSEPRAFDFTDYYVREMGGPLWRRYVSFRELVDPKSLPELKLWTNDLEGRLAADDKRSVNIDPGMLSVGNMVLATCKPAPHRPYLGSGIFADLTLIFEGGEFRPMEWTYPDYREEAAREFLRLAREVLLFELRSIRKKEGQGKC